MKKYIYNLVIKKIFVLFAGDFIIILSTFYFVKKHLLYGLSLKTEKYLGIEDKTTYKFHINIFASLEENDT